MDIGAKYLRKVNKALRCPRKLKRCFLQQLKEDIWDYCAEHPDCTIEALEAQYGKPEAVAGDFYAQADPCAVSRFAYTRLRFAYGLLAIVAAVSFTIITVNAVKHMKIKQLLGNPYTADTFVHPDGTVCSMFTVRTNYHGKDVYWEYHTCVGGMWLTAAPEDSDGTEPYAVDIYINDKGTLEHWTYSEDNFYWIRVYDD